MKFHVSLLVIVMTSVMACTTHQELPPVKPSTTTSVSAEGEYQYRIGAGDLITVTVWRNGDLSGDYIVGPDGTISVSLSDPIQAAGFTVTELKEKLTQTLSKYIKTPRVTVVVKNAISSVEQIRVIGTAAKPIAVSFKKGMTLLDLMITTGGLTTYADGNASSIIRNVDGHEQEFRVRLKDLIQDGDMSANIELQPGDVVKIPEAWF